MTPRAWPDRARAASQSVLLALLGLLALAVAPVGDDPASPRRSAPATAEAAERQPNLIVIMTDDQTVADLAAMPSTQQLLAEQGTSFRRSYASYPVCCPSRATFLTGQYAHNHKVMGLYPPSGGYGRFDRYNNLAVWLQRAGYTTVHIGKYLNGYGSQLPATVPAGWSEWYGAVDDSTYRMWGYTLNENGTLHHYGQRLSTAPGLYQTDVFSRKATDFIARRAHTQQPFFLSLAYVAPHHETQGIRAAVGAALRPAPRHRGLLARAQLPAGPDFAERDLSDKPRFIRRNGLLDARTRAHIRLNHERRLESLLAVDEGVRDIVAELERQHELEHSYILFTSDNGFMQGQHQVGYGKMLAYDPSTRVPLLLRGPSIPPGGTSDELVVNTDLAPTLLELAQATPGKLVDGRSLLEFAQQPQLRSSRPILHESGGRRGHVRPLDQDQGEQPALRQVLTYQALRTRRYLYVRYHDGERELYDMARDPYQLRSLHSDSRYRPVRRALARELLRLVRCAGPACNDSAGYIPRP